MTRLYGIFRIAGYAGGLAGLVLFTFGRQTAGAPAWMAPAGGVLIILSFMAFFASYVLFVLHRLMRGGR